MSVVVETEEGYFCTQGSSGTSVAVTGGNLIDFFIFNMSDAEGNPHSTVTVYVAVQAAPPVEIDAVTLAVTPPSATSSLSQSRTPCPTAKSRRATS